MRDGLSLMPSACTCSFWAQAGAYEYSAALASNSPLMYCQLARCRYNACGRWFDTPTALKASAGGRWNSLSRLYRFGFAACL